MKRDTTCNVSIATEHPQMTEEANLKATYTPGRAGGTFGLPLGAKVIVPEGLCGKKETITCKVAPPSQRWQHTPTFPGEHVTSEFFTLSGNINLKQPKLDTPGRGSSRRRGGSAHSAIRKRTVILILPYYPPEDKFLELNVKGMWRDETIWTDVGFIPKDDSPQPCVELEIDRLGTFAVTFRSKTDQFQMTPNGGLFHSRLNRNLIIRFPKKAVETTVSYNMHITPIPEERVAFSRENFPQECGDMQVVTEFIDLGPDVQCNFRRPATIKLPLPAGVEVEEETSQEVVVLHKTEGAPWEWVDSKYKFSRHNVTLDIKNPSKFCVVKSKPDRHKKMQEAVTVLEQRMDKEKGAVTLFLSLQAKSWMAVLEVYPEASASEKVQARQEQGFKAVEKAEAAPKTQQRESYSRRALPIARDFRPKQMEGFELYDGLSWSVQLSDDLVVAGDSDLHENSHLRCFRHLNESYRRFVVEPNLASIQAMKKAEGDGEAEGDAEGEESKNEKETQYCDLRGTVVLTPLGVDDPRLVERLTLTFHVVIPEEAVRQYYYVPPPPPEPQKPKPKLRLDLPSLLAPEPKPVVKAQVTEKHRTFSASAMERLTQHTRRVNVPEKEAKVLTGKSLMTLSKVVSEGLTLAVHLDLPESTITGIGFDALSSGRSMADVSYKILLYWKRTRKDKRDGAVHHLVEGLRGMGKYGVADVILDRHRDNKELTMDCFLSAAVAGVNLATR